MSVLSAAAVPPPLPALGTYDPEELIPHKIRADGSSDLFMENPLVMENDRVIAPYSYTLEAVEELGTKGVRVAKPPPLPALGTYDPEELIPYKIKADGSSDLYPGVHFKLRYNSLVMDKDRVITPSSYTLEAVELRAPSCPS
jgi:hypothetical protein